MSDFKLALNISYEPKTSDGGIIVNKYGDSLSELYIDECTSKYQIKSFYVKINNIIIESKDNKIVFNNNILINTNLFPIVYNVHNYATLIAVYNTKEKLEHECLVYN